MINIDVLAVMDHSIAVAKDNAFTNAGEGPKQHIGECEKARAAVAELIDKANALLEQVDHQSLVRGWPDNTQRNELRAALAHIVGAA